jgi:hypothetical protein
MKQGLLSSSLSSHKPRNVESTGDPPPNATTQREQMTSEREEAPEPGEDRVAADEREAERATQKDILTFPESGPVTSDSVARMLSEEGPWKCLPLTKSGKADFKVRRS